MFITFEGIDGSGKTSQSVELQAWLKTQDINCVLTKEPGAEVSPECLKIRRLILDPANDITSRTEFYLYLADRAQHVERVISPASKDGRWVVCDRYVDSTRIYQGVGRALGLDTVDPMIFYASHGVMPDITFIMDMPNR